MSPPPHSSRARERPDRSDPAADRIGHRFTGGPPPPAGSPGPAPIPGSLGASAGTGAGAFPPAGGSWTLSRTGPCGGQTAKASYAKYQISRSQRSSGNALLAFALRAPVPPAFGPGPSPRVFPPIPRGESRAISRLNDVSPGSPNVLRAIPRPMTGVPGIAGGRRRRHFYQGRRRLCRYNRCGRWGRS
jgi:hypothetical protein